jgi:hypothetical protein
VTARIKHAKTNAIANWTQPELDTIVAGGPAPLPPPGTTLSQVVLPTDWNDDHVIDTTGASNGDVLTVVAGVAEWAPSSGGSGFSAITSGTNTTAAMVVGTGASLSTSGTGSIQATNVLSGSQLDSYIIAMAVAL